MTDASGADSAPFMHYVEIEVDPGSFSRVKILCRAVEGAPCRDMGGKDCQCEGWIVQTDPDGRRWHYEGGIDDLRDWDYPEPPAKHYHVDAGECLVAVSINDSDAEDQLTEPFTLTTDVETFWSSDAQAWQWKQGVADAVDAH